MTQYRPRYATSRDDNQAEIVDELRALGFFVADTSAHTAEWDVVVWGYHAELRRCLWGHFEIKTAKGKLQPSQRKFASLWPDAVPVVTCAEEVLRWYRRIDGEATE